MTMTSDINAMLGDLFELFFDGSKMCFEDLEKL